MISDAFYVDLGQVRRRLFTHEDRRYHRAHAVLGAACMAHFAYQTARMFSSPGYTILEHPWMPFLLLPHLALHVSSFEFALSSSRNLKYNIIWPEMRWHSLIFAYRSILCIAAAYYARHRWLVQTVLRTAVVFSTFCAADYTTLLLRSKDTTTMRNNPWPEYVPARYVRVHNAIYSMAQFAATVVCLSGDANVVFLSLIAIQTAPFGMTLIKKGVIRSLGWHASYTAALAIPTLYDILVVTEYGSILHRPLLNVLFVMAMRLGLCANKYALWAVVAFNLWGSLRFRA